MAGPPAHRQVECPTCTLLVTVVSGVITPHRGFLGRNSGGIQVADHCPAGSCLYADLTQADYIAEAVAP